MHLEVSVEELDARREKKNKESGKTWRPKDRQRVVSKALRAYSALTTSAAMGGVRKVEQVEF